jgi:hypothetical protein
MNTFYFSKAFIKESFAEFCACPTGTYNKNNVYSIN